MSLGLVGDFDLPALVLDLAEQPGVLDRQHRLCRKGFQKLDHFGAKLAGRFSPYYQAADDAVFAQQGNSQAGAKPKALQQSAACAARKRALPEYSGTATGSRLAAARPTTPSPSRGGFGAQAR